MTDETPQFPASMGALLGSRIVAGDCAGLRQLIGVVVGDSSSSASSSHNLSAHFVNLSVPPRGQYPEINLASGAVEDSREPTWWGDVAGPCRPLHLALLCCLAPKSTSHNPRGGYPLGGEELETRIDVVKCLLEFGAGCNDPCVCSPDTPLLTACRNSYSRTKSENDLLVSVGIRLIEILVARGANVNQTSTAGTPLHYSCWRGSERIVAVLLKLGADPNLKGCVGDWDLTLQTALHVYSSNNERIINMLLDAGARVSAEVIERTVRIDFSEDTIFRVVQSAYTQNEPSAAEYMLHHSGALGSAACFGSAKTAVMLVEVYGMDLKSLKGLKPHVPPSVMVLLRNSRKYIQKKMAILCGHHPRLGSTSIILSVPKPVLVLILSFLA
ncbi:hypothetical protein Pelo_7531 [Pelomyxa schiedti]|nr:hypothetical protein Pelo_7531 [Pelomyxa schiedti]